MKTLFYFKKTYQNIRRKTIGVISERFKKKKKKKIENISVLV